MPTAEVLTIGDELLIGQVINTNQAFIAEALNGIGVDVARMTTVGDDAAAIQSAFAAAEKSADLVIVTGGLGPTHDDITRTVVCRFFGTTLVRNQAVLDHIAAIFRERNLALTPLNEDQALVPATARVLHNPAGTAPGLLFEREGKSFIVLPGVPHEMKAIMMESVLPYLAPRVSGTVIRHHTLRTTGIAESHLAAEIGNVGDFLNGATLAFLPSPTGVRLRITVHAKDDATASGQVQAIEDQLTARIGKYVYGTGEDELETVLGRILMERRMTIAVAESCTGGLIASRITDVSGSSAYFERGVVAYSNASKTNLLGVPASMIDAHGAVSSEVAAAMAAGVRRASGTDIGLSTTGIAGPTGGTPEKPVGLVWIGFADAAESIALKFNFGRDRLRTKERAAQAALELVRRKVLGI